MKLGLEKILIILILIVATISISWQIIQVNHNKDEFMPKTSVYQKGEVVTFGKNLGYANWQAEGYEVSAKETRVLLPDEVEKEYNYRNKEKTDLQGFCIVCINVKNQSNQKAGEQGISAGLIPLLVGVNQMTNNFDDELFELLNPDIPPTTFGGFSLNEGENLDVYIPYVINNGNFTNSIFESDMDVLKRSNKYLMLTTYPERKLLELFERGEVNGDNN